jgi:PAS domain S-box-containing protein
MGSKHDVTSARGSVADSHGAEAALQLARSSLLEHLGVPASLHDLSGRIVEVNEAAVLASGLSREQLVGRLYTDPVPAKERSRLERLFALAIEGSPADFETVFVDAAGDLRTTRAEYLPVQMAAATVGVVAFAVPPGAQSELPASPELTPRQLEVLRLTASGATPAQIAEQLVLSTITVRNHLRRIYRRLRVHNGLEAAAAARRLGLLPATPLGAAAVVRKAENKSLECVRRLRL